MNKNNVIYELSGDDMVRVIQRYDPTFNKQDIIEYPDLAKMNLNLLLPHENSYKVIFFITGEHGFSKEGHWCVIARKGGKVLWFDPYGLKADSEEKWLSKRDRIKFREDKPILHKIVPKNNLISNPYDFQSEKPNINTCGRHVISFIKFCNIEGHSIEEYHNYMESLRRNTGQSLDQIVVNLIRL
jgi:hypothetical protein